MAREWEKTISDAYKKLAGVVADATKLEVKTQFVEVGERGTVVDEEGVVDPQQIVLNAYTKIDLIDGDYVDVVPVRQTADGYEIHDELYDLHKVNTAEARAYVASLVEALMRAVQSLTS